jgi:hypothetical protein
MKFENDHLKLFTLSLMSLMLLTLLVSTSGSGYQNSNRTERPFWHA